MTPLDDDRSSLEDKPKELRATLGEHLEELRQRLFRVIGALIVGMVGGWMIFAPVLNELNFHAQKGFSEQLDMELVFTSIQDAFFLKFKMAFYLSLVIVLPVLVMQIWGFISPGLKPQERKPVKIVAPISVLLFFLGGLICWQILPITLGWFSGFAIELNAPIMQDPAKLIFLMVKMILAFGIGFQMPLIVFFLARFGIITPEGLLRYWRHSIFGVFVASALITPSGDPVGMLSMALPLTLLFFISVYAAKWSMKGRDNADDELNSLD